MAERGRYDATAITAAVTGGDVLPSQSKYLPCGPEAIIEAGIGAAKAGATCVHLHARESDGKPTGSPEMFKEIVDGIRSQTDVVINISTGGAPGMPAEERLAGMLAASPEIASLNLGTMNYEGFPDRNRLPEVTHPWEREVLAKSGDGVFINTLNSLRYFVSQFKQAGVTPELEAYDLGHLSMARFLLDEGTLEGPVRVQLVLGVLGGAGNSLREMFMMYEAAHQILGDDLASLGVASVGYPGQFRAAAVGLSLGMDCRVGIEDNLRLRRKVVAETNAELVVAAVEIAERVGRPILSPAELRAQLGPWHRP